MLFTNPLTLILSIAPAVLLAAPTAGIEKRQLDAWRINDLLNSNCDISKAAMPGAPTPLPAPSEGLKLAHIALGRGTQNYTCASSTSSDAPKAIGAIAPLYNITCMAVRAPNVFNDLVQYAMMDQPRQDIGEVLESGHHEFTETGVPLFKLQTATVNYGYVKGKLAANSTAPTRAIKGQNGAVAWLKLNAVEGDYKEIYRLETAGGAPPKTCEGQASQFIVPYATQYWFWK